MISQKILLYFYPLDTPLRRLLILHSSQVRDKALSILDNPACADLHLNRQLVIDGAMLHDIGISRCDAPGILCEGDAPYVTHGTIGAQMLRGLLSKQDVLDALGLSTETLEPLARICELHTGAGLTREDVEKQQIPIPVKDYLPETMEEKLVCLADKFFSKSGEQKEKSLEHVRRSMMKFGSDSLARFDELCRIFHVN